MWGSRISFKAITQFTWITSMMYLFAIIINANNKINIMLFFIVGPNIAVFEFTSK